VRPAEEAAPDPGPPRARRHREAELAKQRKQIDALTADAVKAKLNTAHTKASSVGQRPASLSPPPLEPLGLGREELKASMAKIAAFEAKGGTATRQTGKMYRRDEEQPTLPDRVIALPDDLRPFITAKGEGSVDLHDVRVGSSPRMSTGSKGGGSSPRMSTGSKGGGSSPRMSTGSKGGGSSPRMSTGSKGGGKGGGKGSSGKGGGELSCRSPLLADLMNG